MLALSVRVLAWCFGGVEIGVEILRGGAIFVLAVCCKVVVGCDKILL